MPVDGSKKNLMLMHDGSLFPCCPPPPMHSGPLPSLLLSQVHVDNSDSSLSCHCMCSGCHGALTSKGRCPPGESVRVCVRLCERVLVCAFVFSTAFTLGTGMENVPCNPKASEWCRHQAALTLQPACWTLPHVAACPFSLARALIGGCRCTHKAFCLLFC